MTRRSKRELERAAAELAGGSNDDDDAFHCVQIGGDPDADEGGYYVWNGERGVYENDVGHEIPPEDAPDSEFEFNINSEGAPSQ